MERQVRSIDDIKRMYPEEWVLIGNPEMDESELQVLSGIPLLHSKDKKEIYYLGRSETSGYLTITVIYTGAIKPARVLTGIFNSTKK